MPAKLLDGKALAASIQEEISAEVAGFTNQTGIKPCLAAILVGENPASEVYVRNKRKACERCGMDSQLHRIKETVSTADLIGLIDQLNSAPEVHGILVQLPLPRQVVEQQVLDAVLPEKDVDGFHPENVGLLSQGRPRFVPCTPLGVQQMLVRQQVPTAGRHAVIIGRSEIVGKPMGMLLLQKGVGGDATVTTCHSRTKNLAAITRQADILIAAIGSPNFVTADMVQPGAVVIDVGINRIETGLVGDVDFAAVREIASLITPVPGGVGPLTVTMLLHNTLKAARLLSK